MSNVIPIKARTDTSKQCRYKPTCPVFNATHPTDPVAAIYSIVTSAGLVLDGAYEVGPDQVEDLLHALDRLTFRLHRLLAA